MQIHQADSPLYVWPDVWSADLHLLMKSMVIHDTECPYWDQVSLNNTNQSIKILFSRSVQFLLYLFPLKSHNIQAKITTLGFLDAAMD